MKAFCPTGETKRLSVTGGGGSARVSLPTLDPVCGVLRVRSSASVTLNIAFGDATVMADSNSMSLYPETTYLRVPPGATHIAAISGGTSTTVEITAGQ